MEKVINLLYEIEEKANRIIDRVSEEKTVLYQQSLEDIGKFDRKLEGETKKKLNELKAKLDREVEKERQIMIRSNDKLQKDLEQNYKKNHDKFVSTIFHNIIGE